MSYPTIWLLSLVLSLDCSLISMGEESTYVSLLSYFYFALVFIAAFCMIITHLLNLLLPSCPNEPCSIAILPIITVGIGYSILGASIWGAISDIVPLKNQGTAYGLSFAISNAGLALTPTIGGYIHDMTITTVYGFFWVIHFLIINDCSNRSFGLALLFLVSLV